MKVSKRGIDFIKKHEGLRLTAYLCPANVWTIGYGTTKNVKRGQRITEQQAEDMLKDDLADFEKTVNTHVTAPMTQWQFDAMVSFVYNVGVGAFRASTLLKRLNALEYVEVPRQLMRWTRGGGKVLPGLVRRRQEEAKLFTEAKYA